MLGTRATESVLRSFKGGDPAARSRTATLLRLHPSHQLHLRRTFAGNDFGASLGSVVVILDNGGGAAVERSFGS